MQLLYRAWNRKDLCAIGRQPVRRFAAAVFCAAALTGCSLSSHLDTFSDSQTQADITGSIRSARVQSSSPSESDLALARLAASDVLSRGDKNASQPWENPATGARGSVTPLANAYSADGRTCRDFLASYVHGSSESWMQGAACQADRGSWEIRSMKPWRQS